MRGDELNMIIINLSFFAFVKEIHLCVTNHNQESICSTLDEFQWVEHIVLQDIR